MDGSQREKWLNSIWPNGLINNHEQILEVFRIETENYRNGIDSDYYENVYQTALYLYVIGDVRDSVLIYDAKNSSFDLSCGIDFQFMLGAGIDATYNYAKKINRHDIEEYLDSLRGSPDLSDIKDWYKYRVQYYGLS
jgi:hypothetical protein